MYSIKTIFCLLSCLSVFACSSTEQANNKQFLDNGYSQGYVNESSVHTEFSAVNNNTVLKDLGSDHELMLSLLNRGMTKDQAMMLSFAQQRASYTAPYQNRGIEIKGARRDNDNTRVAHLYAHLIEKDTNAVIITASSL